MTTQLLVLPEFKFTTFTPAVVEFNGAEIKAALSAFVEKYENLKVTSESLADDKKLTQDIKKLIKAIDRERIDRKKQLNLPVAALEAEMKEITGVALAVVEPLENQIKQFEAAKLVEIGDAIADEFDVQADALKLRSEFANFGEQVEQLTKLTAVTAKGALTAKTKGEITAIVASAQAMQNSVDLRLARLESECYRLGLAAPLTRAHVAHILLSDDACYQAELEKIVAAEVEREKQAVEAHKRKLEAEAKAKADAEMQAQLEQERKARAEIEAKERAEFEAKAKLEAERAAKLVQLESQQAQPTPEPVKFEQPQAQADTQQPEIVSGKVAVVFTFEVDFQRPTPVEAIKAKYTEVLAGAGFTTLKNIQLTEVEK